MCMSACKMDICEKTIRFFITKPFIYDIYMFCVSAESHFCTESFLCCFHFSPNGRKAFKWQVFSQCKSSFQVTSFHPLGEQLSSEKFSANGRAASIRKLLSHWRQTCNSIIIFISYIYIYISSWYWIIPWMTDPDVLSSRSTASFVSRTESCLLSKVDTSSARLSCLHILDLRCHRRRLLHWCYTMTSFFEKSKYTH